jgi:predicted aminopeptidase
MSNQVQRTKEDLEREKQSTEYYKKKFEEERLRNQDLHEALADLRQKCEKWYNSAEMEEEMIVNKARSIASTLFSLLIFFFLLSLLHNWMN